MKKGGNPNKQASLQLRIGNLGIRFPDDALHRNKMRNIVTDAMQLTVKLDQFVAIDALDLPVRQSLSVHKLEAII